MANALEGEIVCTVSGDSFQGFGMVQKYSFGFCAGERGEGSSHSYLEMGGQIKAGEGRVT